MLLYVGKNRLKERITAFNTFTAYILEICLVIFIVFAVVDLIMVTYFSPGPLHNSMFFSVWTLRK